MAKKVLVVIPVEDRHKKKLEAVGGDLCEFVYRSPNTVTKEEVKEAEVLIGNVSPDLVDSSVNLKLFQLNSAGADPYVQPGVLDKGTILTNATGAYSKSVAEHCFAMTLMLQKKLHLYRDNQHKASWEDLGNVTSLSYGRVLVVGLGDIGEYYARLCKNMGATVVGIKRRPGNKPDFVDELYLTESLMDELKKADVVFSILPGTKETYHFYKREHFAAMKETAVFINAGRGSAVETRILEEALKTGQISSAGIDVTEIEPLPEDDPIWKLPNILITPHISGFYHLAETFEHIVDIACDNLLAYLLGKEMKNVVDFGTGYKK